MQQQCLPPRRWNLPPLITELALAAHERTAGVRQHHRRVPSRRADHYVLRDIVEFAEPELGKAEMPSKEELTSPQHIKNQSHTPTPPKF